MKLSVFIGSSSEALEYARAVQENLNDDVRAIVWDQDVFRLSKPTLESLMDVTADVDAAIFILAPDDRIKIRGSALFAARDNVIYELGLFCGRLEPHRCFVIAPKIGKKMRLPSDLMGFQVALYDPEEKNPVRALGNACHRVRRELKELGKFSPEAAAFARDSENPIGSIDCRDLEGYWLSQFHFRSHRGNEYAQGVEYSLEKIDAVGSHTLVGENLHAWSSNARDYRHKLRMSVLKSHLVGRWFNTNHESVGACQLRVHSDRHVLEGMHLGDADDKSVQPGSWVWLRLSPDARRGLDKNAMADRRFISADDLDKLFHSHLRAGKQIPMSKIWER